MENCENKNGIAMENDRVKELEISELEKVNGGIDKPGLYSKELFNSNESLSANQTEADLSKQSVIGITIHRR